MFLFVRSGWNVEVEGTSGSGFGGALALEVGCGSRCGSGLGSRCGSESGVGVGFGSELVLSGMAG